MLNGFLADGLPCILGPLHCLELVNVEDILNFTNLVLMPDNCHTDVSVCLVHLTPLEVCLECTDDATVKWLKMGCGVWWQIKELDIRWLVINHMPTEIIE